MDKDLEEFIQIKTNEPYQVKANETELVTQGKVIHVKCNYLPSCFGAALSLLNQCVGANGMSLRDELSKIESDDLLLLLESKRLNEFTLPVPKELYRMVNFILQEGKLKPNIFLTSGNASQSRLVRDKIDTNQPLSVEDGDDPYTVATVLIDFLQTLLTPILPVNILDDIVSLYEGKL